ncbi:MAG: flavocytochrome C, partial [Betaproteobacteria bacterium]
MKARRDFLKAASAGVAASVLGSCATMGAGRLGKVVVVGGGYGGATAAKYIAMWSNGAVDVTLVETN